jgi:hypothetical protein
MAAGCSREGGLKGRQVRGAERNARGTNRRANENRKNECKHLAERVM